jgi:hypothetical protein
MGTRNSHVSLDMPPSRHDGDGPQRQRDRQAAWSPPEHGAARARAQSMREWLGYRPDSAQRRAWAGSCAARRSRASPACGSTSRTALPWDGRPSRSRGGWSRKERSTRSAWSHLSPRLQPRRPARRAAQDACATQAEARPATAQRTPGAHDPQPDANPSAPHEGPSPQPVRTLGGRPHALPPPARHPPDAAGKALPADAGPSPSRQGRRAHRRGHRGTGRLPAGLARRTITHDNGGEFARHEAVTAAIGLAAYFCDPHSPRQRGSIENANGRLRRDLPRKTSLGYYSDADIDDVIWNLNATPRKCLGYRTPIKAFAAR